MAQDQATVTTDTLATPDGFMSRTFESLSIRNFRYLWFGSLLGMAGFQMQSIARTIFVDELTHSAFITSIVGMGFAPTLLIFSLVGGVVGDRVERRMVIQASQAAAAFLALTIATLIAVNMIHWTHLLVASMIQGALFSFQMPARQAILPTDCRQEAADQRYRPQFRRDEPDGDRGAGYSRRAVQLRRTGGRLLLCGRNVGRGRC